MICNTEKEIKQPTGKNERSISVVFFPSSGIATLAIINCGKAKKVCKKLKSSPNPRELKHFKDGEYHKDYDRQDTAKSMINFLRDPTGIKIS